MLTTLEQIQAFAQRVGEEFSPQQVILFGSYAYGQPTPDSDVNLLVITPFEGNWVAKGVQIRLKIRAPFTLSYYFEKTFGFWPHQISSGPPKKSAAARKWVCRFEVLKWR